MLRARTANRFIAAGAGDTRWRREDPPKTPRGRSMAAPATQPGTALDLSIIDVDAHITEPHDLWTSRAPASMKDRVPRVVGSGKERAWVVDKDIQISTTNPSSVIARNGEKSRGIEFFGWQFEDVHEASYDMKARVELLDRFGLFAQILYPNVAGF